MVSRDVEINLIGRNRLSSATRAAASDLERLARKVDALEKKLANIQGGKVKVKADVDTSQAASLGRRFGNAFSNAVGSAISDGSRAFGNAIRKGLIKGGAGVQTAAALLGLRIAGFIGQAITAGLGLLIGPALLAGPIAFLLAQQLKASKEIEKSETRIAALKKRLELAKGQAAQDRIRKEIAAERRLIAEQEKQAALWERLKSRAKSFMEFISAPLKIPFADALDEIGDGLERLRKPMRSIMEQLGPALAPFTKGVMNSLVEFIKALEPAMPGIAAGMRQWGKEMPKIGKAFGDMIAKIMANPDAVVTAITNVSGAIQGLASFSGTVVKGLTDLGNAFHSIDVAAEALDKGALGKLPNMALGLAGSLRGITRALLEEKVVWLRHLDEIATAWANSPLGNAWAKKTAANIHAARVAAEAELNAITGAWARADAELRRKQLRVEIKANIADLNAKIAEAKAKLADPSLTKPRRAKLELDLARFRLQKSTAKAELVALSKTRTKPKVQAAIEDLQGKVRTAKRQLRTVHDSKTRAKIQADIAAAEAAIARLKGILRSIPDETVNVNVITTKTIVTKRVGGSDEVIRRADSSWGASLNGGGTHRTEGPRVNVESPTVSTRVFLDSREIGAVVHQSVVDENRRAAFRATVGRRN